MKTDIKSKWANKELRRIKQFLVHKVPENAEKAKTANEFI